MSFFLETAFPSLKEGGCQITSEPDKRYNCIAWAAGSAIDWWWPCADDYWPDGVPRETAIEVFEAVFRSVGYRSCADGGLEEGVEKVAIYAVKEVPKHAARQLPDGKWTSKLGRFHDIEHNEAEGIVSAGYGSIVRFMKRPRRST
jgi:hypothetical protein